MTLLVIVPTRKRPELCARLISSFDATTDKAELAFVTDDDDDSYKDFDFKGHASAELSPRGNLVQKLNKTAENVVNTYDHLMWLGDDHVFVTPHWDTKLLAALDDMGGSGWVYANDKRRADIPESWLVSSDVVKELGWLANPHLQHYYIDNCISDIGRRAQLIRYVPDVVIEHKHYSVSTDTKKDALYEESEVAYGQTDLQTYQLWRASNQLPSLVSRLRRKFNPDVKWVLGKV